MVDILLESDALTTAVAGVCCDYNFRTAVRQAILDALATEPTKDNRVNRSNPGAGQHRDDSLRNERHVDQNAVALFDTIALEDISEDADFAMELVIGQRAALTGFAFPNNGRLVAARSVEMAIEAVFRGV